MSIANVKDTCQNCGYDTEMLASEVEIRQFQNESGSLVYVRLFKHDWCGKLNIRNTQPGTATILINGGCKTTNFYRNPIKESDLIPLRADLEEWNQKCT